MMKSHEEATPFAFLDEMKDVKPIVQDTAQVLAKPQKTLAQSLKREALERELRKHQNYLSMENVVHIEHHDPISYKKSGVQEGVFKNLRLGKYRVERTLNLPKTAIESARHQIFEKLLEAQHQGVRTLLIRHGLAHNDNSQPSLKSYIHHWLPQMPEVLAFHTASRQHGGLAAVYVMLKKHPDYKLQNKEQHRKF